MVVMFVIEKVFVARNTIRQLDLPSQPTANHELHHAIDSGVSNARIDGLDGVVNIFDAAVTFIVQKGLQDEFAMRCEFELVGLQVIDKYL